MKKKTIKKLEIEVKEMQNGLKVVKGLDDILLGFDLLNLSEDREVPSQRGTVICKSQRVYFFVFSSASYANLSEDREVPSQRGTVI